jgi:type III secretion protein C
MWIQEQILSFRHATPANSMNYYSFGTILLLTTALCANEAHAVEEEKASPFFSSSARKEIKGNNTYAVSFNNILITDYIRGFVSKVANKNFIFNEDELNFNISFVSPQGTSVDNIMASLAQLLRIRGFSMVEQGNNIIIYKGDDGPFSSQVITDEQDELPSLSEASVITRVFRLINSKVENVEKIVRPMLSANAVVAISPESKHLIVTDYNANIKKLQQLIHDIESSQNYNEQVQVYKSRGTNLDQLVAMASKVIVPGLGERKPRFELDEKNQSIFILGSSTMIQRVLKVFEIVDNTTSGSSQIDNPIALGGEAQLTKSKEIDSGSGFHVYKLQYHRGDKIKEALIGMGQALNTAGFVTQDVINTINTAQWIESSNSLMFAGQPEAINKVKQLLKESDKAPKQVFIEVLVIQTNLNNTFDFGVEWSVAGPKVGGSFGSSGATNLAVKSTASVKGTTFLSENQSGQSDNGQPSARFQGGVVGSILRHKNGVYTTLSAMVKALETDGKTQILINPKLITQDNIPAVLEIAEDFQVNAGQTTTNTATGQTTKADTAVVKAGNVLKITPIIDDDNMVTLEIDFEVSSLKDAEKNYTKAFTHTKTRVHVPNNNFLVLSGQIRDQQRQSNEKIPCLGSIAGIGSLFGSKSRNAAKDSMLVFIRPKVLEDEEALEKETVRQRYIVGKNSYTKEFANTLDATLQFLQVDPRDIPSDSDEEG